MSKRPSFARGVFSRICLAVICTIALCVVMLPEASLAARGSAARGPRANQSAKTKQAKHPRHARLSADLQHAVASGDLSGRTIIVTANRGRVQKLVRRHGLELVKWLKSGAVLQVPEGALEALADDELLDQASGDHVVRGSMDVTKLAVGADQAWDGTWQSYNQGTFGYGVTVAVIDTGVDMVAGLSERVIANVNFTDEPDATDNNGHGTHVAGVIAASRGATGSISTLMLQGSSTGGAANSGMAPAANIVNLARRAA